MLYKIALKYNEHHQDKIELPQAITDENRKKYWTNITNKMNKATSCENEYCWLKHFNLKYDPEINDSFRPKKPNSWNNNNTEWLSTSDINNVLKPYEKSNVNYKYMGAVPVDFDIELVPGMCISDELCKINLKKLYLNGYRKIGSVFNLDPHDKPGSHWVSMFTDLTNGGIYYFDSYGTKPPKEVTVLMERIRSQGNNLIREGVIDLKNLENDYEIETSFKLVTSNKIHVPTYIDIQEDTPSYFAKTGDSINSKNMYNTIKKSVLVGGGNGYQEIILDKHINNISEGKFIQKGFKKFYNNIRFQYKGSECGVYSIHFQTELLKGIPFYNVIKNIIDDDTMNKQRDFYYRPTN